MDAGVSRTAVPAVAAAASWMESYSLPLREIRKRYTKSEVMIMAWRSGEIGFNMGSKAMEGELNRMAQQPKQLPESATDAIYEEINPMADKELAEIERKLGPTIVTQMVDEKTGEINLSKLTGQQALTYLSALNIGLGRS